ncbi:replication initiation protein [Endozoicomonas sp. SM1973]|uniref:Replication initiation protein n=1 Tax=Spartinivicinus marinus TaxID=2994442 RepID=A0A853IDG5_9GAMM|nr:replication initiation protein [Spartinivicinus marinus]NYZ69902.1 replication initiation protein [Spartinivicinus marinus]
MSQIVQLNEFKKRLPKKPYYTNELSSGLLIADVARAVEARYIQPNPPHWRYYFIFDVDRSGAAIDWYDRNAPAPTFTITNRVNGHAHLAYGVATSIITAPHGNDAPLRYAAAIEASLRAKLDADIGYSGLVCKNPLHGFWRVTVWEPELYTLDWLADYLDLSPYDDRRKNLPPYGLGRNHTLFTRTRRWSYKAIRQGWPEYDRWLLAVLERAQAYNDFEHSLHFTEVKATAKSVARWTHRKFSPESFSAWQSAQGKKGGAVRASTTDMAALGALKGKARREALLPLVLEKHAQGMTQQGIADDLGIPQKTVSNWIRSLKE